MPNNYKIPHSRALFICPTMIMFDLSFDGGSGFFWQFSFSLSSLAPALASGLNYFPHFPESPARQELLKFGCATTQWVIYPSTPQPLFEIFTQPPATIVAPNHYYMSIDQCSSGQLTQQTNKCKNQTNNAVEVPRQFHHQCHHH